MYTATQCVVFGQANGENERDDDDEEAIEERQVTAGRHRTDQSDRERKRKTEKERGRSKKKKSPIKDARQAVNHCAALRCAATDQLQRHTES